MEFNSIIERNKFIEDNLPLVTLAVKRANNNLFDDDLFQFGCCYFIENVLPNFDSNKGYKFSTYAVTSMYLKILDYIKKDKLIKPVRHYDKQTGKTTYDYAITLFFSQDIENEDKSITEKQITVEDLLSYMSTTGQEDPFEKCIEKLTLQQFYNKELTNTEKQVVEHKFSEHTQKEIAKALNISQPMVSKILNNIRQKYRLYLEKSDKL